MGLILGALGGAGAQAADLADKGIAQQDKLDALQMSSDLEQQRAQALAQFKVQLEDQQRQQMVGRINAAAQPILDQGIIARAASARASTLDGTETPGTPADGAPPNSDFTGNDQVDPALLSKIAAIPDPTQRAQAVQAAGITPDSLEYSLIDMKDPTERAQAIAAYGAQRGVKQSSVANLTLGDLTDAEKTQFAPSASQQADARLRAAEQTGDLSPKDAATLAIQGRNMDARLAAMDSRMAIAQLRNQAYSDRTSAEQSWHLAQIEARIEAAGNKGGGNTDFDKKVQLLKDGGATPGMIRDFIMERKQPSLTDIASKLLSSDPNAGFKTAMTPEQAVAKAKGLLDTVASVRGDVSAPSNPATSPTTPANRPPLSAFQKN